MNAKEITVQSFEKDVMRSRLPVMVDFWASWCGPCKMVSPLIDELAEEYDGRAAVGKINVDEQAELAERFRVMTIPTVMIFKNGEPVDKLVGVKSKEELAQMLEKQF